jgi:hypothetical protein
MGEYEVGRDLQELRSRIERLESGCPDCRERSPGYGDASHPGARHPGGHRLSGLVHHSVEAGVHPEKKPIAWKADKAIKLPPFLSGMFGHGANVRYDAAQSQTWSCQPEPLILSVSWDAGGTDEYYRLTNQVFSILRVLDPNTGITTATAIYSAQLIASGRAKNSWNAPPHYFNGTLRNAGGAALAFFGDHYWINCQDNYPFNIMGNFPPALYDLVAGATWNITGSRVDHC